VTSHGLIWISACNSLDPIARWYPRENQTTIDIEKCLILIIWSINEIHSLLDVPKCIAYNNTFFCNSVVFDLVENICAHSRRKTLKNIMVHFDDARPHNSKKSIECLEQFRICRVPHRVYNPDLAPSNLFLFGHVKSKLPGLTIRSKEDLIYEIRRIFEKCPLCCPSIQPITREAPTLQ
jgi:hypothetical protein